MKKQKKKIVGSVQRGVYVSAVTKKQFKKDADQYRSDGIRSPYALQIQKDIAKRAKLRANAGISRAELASLKEYYNASSKFREIGYDFADLKNFFKRIKKSKKDIEKDIKKGYLPYTTPKPYLPVYNNAINVNRLAKILLTTKETKSERREKAYDVFDSNVMALFDEEMAEELIELAHRIPAGVLYNEFENHPRFNALVIYEYEAFDVDDRPDVEAMRDDIFSDIGSAGSYDYIREMLLEIIGN